MCSKTSLKSLSQLKTKFTWDHRGIGEKIYSNDSGQLLFFILICQPQGAGAFSGDFTTDLARQCRALKSLKPRYSAAPRGAGLQTTGALVPTFLNFAHTSTMYIHQEK